MNTTGTCALAATAIMALGIYLGGEFGDVMAIAGLVGAVLIGGLQVFAGRGAAPPPRVEPSEDALAAAFRLAPEECLYRYGGERYQWPDQMDLGTTLADIYVRALDRDVGYIQDICFITPTCVRVGHFATKAAGQRKGTGSGLARFLATQLKTRYGVTQIVFAQRHPRPHDSQFFASLGAVPVEVPQSITPDWHWSLT